MTNDLLLVDSGLSLLFVISTTLVVHTLHLQQRIVLPTLLYVGVLSILGLWAARYDVHWFAEYGLFSRLHSGIWISCLAYTLLLNSLGVKWKHAIFIALVAHCIVAVGAEVASEYGLGY